MVRPPSSFEPHTAAADATAEEGVWELISGPRTKNLLRLTYHASGPFHRAGAVFDLPPYTGASRFPEIGVQHFVLYTNEPEEDQVLSMPDGKVHIHGGRSFTLLHQHHFAPQNFSERLCKNGASHMPFGMPKELFALDMLDGAGEDLCDWAFHADPMSLIETVKQGLSPDVVPHLACSMLVSQEKVLSTLGLPQAAYQRKASKNEALSSDESSRVMGMARLIGQAQAMVSESGAPEGFVAAEWVANWLDEPLPALCNRRPAEFMDTAEGQNMVSQLLASMVSGAYA